MPKCLPVNDLIPACETAIRAFEMKLKCEGNSLLKETLPVAHSLLQELIRVHEEFHVKVEEYGPPKLPKYDDGHEYTVQQRCYGDGRLFIKVRVGFGSIHVYLLI